MWFQTLPPWSLYENFVFWLLIVDGFSIVNFQLLKPEVEVIRWDNLPWDMNPGGQNGLFQAH